MFLKREIWNRAMIEFPDSGTMNWNTKFNEDVGEALEWEFYCLRFAGLVWRRSSVVAACVLIETLDRGVFGFIFYAFFFLRVQLFYSVFRCRRRCCCGLFRLRRLSPTLLHERVEFNARIQGHIFTFFCFVCVLTLVADDHLSLKFFSCIVCSTRY